MKRLGIFCMYDREGIVDDYILYLLQEIKKVLSHLTIVCNGKLLPEGRARLEKCTDDIFVRDNVGFDFAAWRHGILSQKDTLQDYDELILFNDSFYGPFYPFQEIFDEMEKRAPADFWGITLHERTDAPYSVFPEGYIREHLQSYFLVIRHRLLKSGEFLDYWQTSEESQSMDETIRTHEVRMTQYFLEKGFSYDVYCNTKSEEQINVLNINPYIFYIERLLKDYRCPIVKKRIFLLPRNEYLIINYGTAPRKTLDFIKNKTNYDEKLIWQNLLRKQNVAAIKSNLGLDYILPTDTEISDVDDVLNQTVIIAHLYYEDLAAECVNYLCNAPQEISIIITVNSEKMKNVVEKLLKDVKRNFEVRLVKNRGRDLSALLVGCADVFQKFKYLCFIHDKKSIREHESVEVGSAFFKLLWQNILCNEVFIKNILATFEAEPYLGLLAPPHPYNGYYLVIFLQKFWSDACFKKTLELAKELDIPENFFSVDFPPLAIGSAFWCRTEALKKITQKNWTVEDFPEEPIEVDGTISHALERIFPFAAQASGFYTGWAITQDFAKDELENFIHLTMNQQAVPQTKLSFADFLRQRIPKKYWGILRPFKRMLERFGLIRHER